MDLQKILTDIYPDYGVVGNLTHARGARYTQFWQVYPATEPFYSTFEKNFDPTPILMQMGSPKNYWIPVVCVVVYMLFCYFGQKVMANYKAFDLIGPLAAWNLFLSLFSIYGAIRTVPHILHRITTLPFIDTVCEASFTAYGHGACGLATQLFIISKIPELVDTVFIVLRKKPLIFLHWYHHVTVLVYCWNAYVTESSAGIWFIAMNYTVHGVMYFYYFLQAIRAIPKWFPSWIITLMQITQMIIGTFIVCSSFYFHFYGGKGYAPGACNNQPSNLFLGGVIYASYLYLFVEFAFKRFIFGDSKPKTKKPVKSE